MENRKLENRKIICKLYNDHFQNYKSYGIQKAQLIIADIPYNVGKNAFGSNPSWYIGGDNKNGESDKANTEFFDTDKDFRPAEFMHFCSHMMKKEPKQRGKAPAMLVFCAFDQQMYLIELAKRYGINNYINLVFRKNFSAQVLKANMRVVGNCEYALLLYRDKLPKFNNGCQKDENGKTIAGTGKMVFNWFNWVRENKKLYPKIHPTQKPVTLLKQLIEVFTDEGDIVIDPCAGSATTLRACAEINRNCYGFEIKKDFFKKANEKMLSNITTKLI